MVSLSLCSQFLISPTISKKVQVICQDLRILPSNLWQVLHRAILPLNQYSWTFMPPKFLE